MTDIRFFDEDDEGTSTRTQDMLGDNVPEHDPNNPAHALYCNPCYNRMPGIGVRPHMQPKDEHIHEVPVSRVQPFKDEIVEQDFTGSISGFDFPIEQDSFDPSILASELDFGSGMPHRKRNWKADYLERNGREDEAFERDE